MRAHGLWQYSFRSYRIISLDDPIYAACVSGDLGRVQQLCSQGKTSPFDRTSDGWTLLHAAAAFLDAKLCRWLISQGLEGSERGKLEWSYRKTREVISPYGITFSEGTTPLHVAATCSGYFFYPDADTPMERDFLSVSNPLDTLRVLIEEGRSDPMVTDDCGWSALHTGTNSWNGFHYMFYQDEYHVDLLQLLARGLVVSPDCQDHGIWGPCSRIADFAFCQEIINEAQGHHRQHSVGFPTLDKKTLLQAAVNYLLSNLDGPGAPEDYAIKLIRRSIASKIDLGEPAIYYVHAPVVMDRNFQEGIIRIPGDQVDVEGVRTEEDPLFDIWLQILKNGDVYVGNHLSHEQRLAANRTEGYRWCYYHPSVGLYFNGTSTPDEDAKNSRYRLKASMGESKETEEEPLAPGAWIEDVEGKVPEHSFSFIKFCYHFSPCHSVHR
ncbi:hypothetical protein MMC13_007022 [Lambiella insularis]|nr:hypothetical protein [Lambiella insularis]